MVQLLRAMPSTRDLGVAGEAGHTLIELAAVVAIVTVAAALALPSVAAMGRGHQLEAAAFGAAQCLRLAHWRAVASGRRVQVCVRRGPDGVWLLATERESGGAWVADGEERRLPAGVVVAVAGPAEKVFNPDGTCSIGSLTLRAGASAAYRCTLAPASGRVRLYRGERELGRGD
ncbi:MAG TPA: GspH/FimT family pseudopilin [bacterium]